MAFHHRKRADQTGEPGGDRPMHTARRGKWAGVGLSVVGTMLAVLLVGVAPALAGVGLGVTPTFPAAAKAGQTNLSGNVTIRYNNTSPDDADTDTVTGILLTPSCGSSVTAGVPDLATCPAAQIDPGVFTIHTPATGTGGCAGVVFAVGPPPGPPDPSGKLLFDPSPSTVTLGPASAACVVHFTFDVVQKPTKDADVSNGLQTAALAAASAQSDFGVPGGGNGSAIISFPTIATTQTPVSGTKGVTTLTDTAALTGLVNLRSTVNTDPTGTVTFTLFDPD